MRGFRGLRVVEFFRIIGDQVCAGVLADVGVCVAPGSILPALDVRREGASDTEDFVRELLQPSEELLLSRESESAARARGFGQRQIACMRQGTGTARKDGGPCVRFAIFTADVANRCCGFLNHTDF